MRFDLAGPLLAASVWLLATVLAWPAGQTTAAVALLAPQAGLYAAIAAGTPTINVRIRRRSAQ